MLSTTKPLCPQLGSPKKQLGKGRKEHKRMPLVHKVKGLEQAPVAMAGESVHLFPIPHPQEHLWAALWG